MSGRRVLIFGAGEAGRMTARLLRSHPEEGLEVVAFLDDDPMKRGTRIEGVPVVGSRADLAKAVAEHAAEEILIAIPSAEGRVVREIVGTCVGLAIRFRIVPGLLSIIRGDVPFDAIREMRPEDLLGRETIEVDPAAHRPFLEGRRVLVTGGAGSIGAEIVRQALAAGAEVAALDASEVAVHALATERQGARVLLGDVRDRAALARRFAAFRPEVVFHAAAYKHVPILEDAPEEAVRTNLLGTNHTLEAAAEAGAERFVLISTDKAVAPAGVMGASKRAAERLVAARAPDLGVAAAIVRFGNVFDSSGSVVPLFRAQIARGGPVTVTHPEVVRYFMTIPEAVHLVLHAARLAEGVDLFALDMGEPIRILDLARAMIALSGKTPEEIPIEVVGLRPGEKLSEEVYDSRTERLEPLSALDASGAAERIHRVVPAPEWPGEWEADLAAFAEAAARGDAEAIRALLARTGDLSA